MTWWNDVTWYSKQLGKVNDSCVTILVTFRLSVYGNQCKNRFQSVKTPLCACTCVHKLACVLHRFWCFLWFHVDRDHFQNTAVCKWNYWKMATENEMETLTCKWSLTIQSFHCLQSAAKRAATAFPPSEITLWRAVMSTLCYSVTMNGDSDDAEGCFVTLLHEKWFRLKFCYMKIKQTCNTKQNFINTLLCTGMPVCVSIKVI